MIGRNKKDSGFFRKGLEMVGLMRVKVDLATLLANPDCYLNRNLETEGDVRYLDSFHPKDEFDDRTDGSTLVSRPEFTEGELLNGDSLYLGVERDTPGDKIDDLRVAKRVWVRGRLGKGMVGDRIDWQVYMIASGKYRIVN